MKTTTIAFVAGASLLSLTAFGQPPPAPPVPPVPPVPPQGGPNHPGRDREAKVPVTWLGVETSGVPRVVSEQLGLAKGFGLVVDYVVPDGPAAAAGVQQSDILKMLNDQILTEPGQLAKLIRSYSDGTTISLTVLRKGAEQKLTVKLAKHDVSPEGNMFGPHFEMHRENGHGHDTGMFNMNMSGLKDELGKLDFSGIRETVQNARREAMRARDEAQRRARELRVVSKDAGAMRSTRIDLAKAQVVLSDTEGEMRIESTNGKKMLTAKDPQGKLLFSGPVETKEELDKVPADVRRRYDKLEQKDLPAVAPNVTLKTDRDNDADDDDDNDTDDEDGNDRSGGAGLEQVSFDRFPQIWAAQAVLI